MCGRPAYPPSVSSGCVTLPLYSGSPVLASRGRRRWLLRFPDSEHPHSLGQSQASTNSQQTRPAVVAPNPDSRCEDARYNSGGVEGELSPDVRRLATRFGRFGQPLHEFQAPVQSQPTYHEVYVPAIRQEQHVKAWNARSQCDRRCLFLDTYSVVVQLLHETLPFASSWYVPSKGHSAFLLRYAGTSFL